MKRLFPLLLLGSVAALLLASAPLALAQGTYTQIDFPGAAQTIAQGIDTAGDIVGFYYDSAGNIHGFLLSGGTYTTIDYPGVLNTYLYGINDAGKIVGSAYFGGDSYAGFGYDISTAEFTEIRFSGVSYTAPTAINDSGTVAGNLPTLPINVGFEVLPSGRWGRIAPLQATLTQITGVTASGALAGFSFTKGGVVNFYFDQGHYRKLLIPDAPTAYVLGTNPEGNAAVGQYQPSPTMVFAFVYQNKTLQTLQLPGINVTYAAGINAAGEVAGSFTDNNVVTHAYTWTPPAPVEKK